MGRAHFVLLQQISLSLSTFQSVEDPDVSHGLMLGTVSRRLMTYGFVNSFWPIRCEFSTTPTDVLVVEVLVSSPPPSPSPSSSSSSTSIISPIEMMMSRIGSQLQWKLEVLATRWSQGKGTKCRAVKGCT